MNQSTTIITEEQFPKTSTKLQGLMKKFRSQNADLPQAVEHIPDPLATVQIVNELSTRTFEELSPEHQGKVLAKIEKIDYMVSSEIQNFGSTQDSKLTQHAEVIISKYSTHELGELSIPMTDLVATLKSKDPQNVVSMVNIEPNKNKTSIFSSLKDILAMKKAKKKMFKIMAEHNTVAKNLEAISSELKKQQISLQKDIMVYENMTTETFDQVYGFELDCIALDLMIEEAHERLNAIVKKGQIDQLEAATAAKLKSAIERMVRRKNTIMSIRVSAIQNIPMLNGIILGDEIVCEKIDEVHSLVIPMWTWQYAIAIGHLKQQEALSFQNTIRGITSKLLTGNAKMLHDNIIAAQEELYSAAVAIEDLMEVQKYIDDMVTTVHEKSKDAMQNCINGMKTMQEIEQKNYNLMSQNLTTVIPNN